MLRTHAYARFGIEPDPMPNRAVLPLTAGISAVSMLSLSVRLADSPTTGAKPAYANLAGVAKRCCAPPEHFFVLDIFNDEML